MNQDERMYRDWIENFYYLRLDTLTRDELKELSTAVDKLAYEIDKIKYVKE